jgi:hypothetical protein
MLRLAPSIRLQVHLLQIKRLQGIFAEGKSACNSSSPRFTAVLHMKMMLEPALESRKKRRKVLRKDAKHAPE